MFKKLFSTVFACALLVNGAVSAQTVDAQALVELSNLPEAQLNELAQGAKEAVVAKLLAEGKTEEQIASVVAQIDNTVASLGSASTSRKEEKIVWIAVGAGLTVGGFLLYKYAYPKLAALLTSKNAPAAETKGAEAKGAEAKGAEAKGAEAKGAVKNSKSGNNAEGKSATAHKGHSHAAQQEEVTGAEDEEDDAEGSDEEDAEGDDAEGSDEEVAAPARGRRAAAKRK